MTQPLTIGLIADTHGLLRAEALTALAGVSRIIHAGDIGGPEVLEALGAIAPVDAVRGNNDRGAWAEALPETRVVRAAGARILVLHDIKTLAVDPAAQGYAVVIAGHSHRPDVTQREGVLFVNPGSAGPRRFSLPVAVGFLSLHPDGPRARIHRIQ